MTFVSDGGFGWIDCQAAKVSVLPSILGICSISASKNACSGILQKIELFSIRTHETRVEKDKNSVHSNLTTSRTKSTANYSPFFWDHHHYHHYGGCCPAHHCGHSCLHLTKSPVGWWINFTTTPFSFRIKEHLSEKEHHFSNSMFCYCLYSPLPYSSPPFWLYSLIIFYNPSKQMHPCHVLVQIQ